MKRRTILGLLIGLTLAAALAVMIFPRQPALSRLEDVKQRRLGAIAAGMSSFGAPLGEPVLIRVFKQSSELELWVKRGDTFALWKAFPICTWSGALGPKLREGDGQSPEGFYRVSHADLNRQSSYHLSFNLGFPNAYDRAQGRTGSFLTVHGACVSIGCYAMTDEGIEEIYLILEAALSGGQQAIDVHVFPFRMTPEAWAQYGASQWEPFWRMMQPAYDLFEARQLPPVISVTNGAYVVQ